MSGTATMLARRGFAARLLGAQGVVLAVTVVTAATVASVVGPPIFHDHLAQAGHALDAEGIGHVEQAYADASYLSLGIALAVALVCATLASWWLAAKVRAPLAELTGAATRMARGEYGARVQPSGTAFELDALATSFNDMAQRLEHVEDTRRRVLSDLAHELRTPIATLSGYLDGLDDGVVPWTAQTRQVLHDQVRRLSRLATDLDDVSRAEEGRITLQRKHIPVGMLIASTAATVRDRFADKGVQLVAPGLEDAHGTEGAAVTEGAAGAAGAEGTESTGGAEGAEGTAYATVVEVDPERLGQVLTNLLGNSLRHTPTGGSVRCAAALTRGSVLLTVTDTGEGIDAQHLPHVFERFYRADPARHRTEGNGAGSGAGDGAGIGLTISAAIVQAHGGRIRAASEGPGRGATFTIELPVATTATPVKEHHV